MYSAPANKNLKHVKQFRYYATKCNINGDDCFVRVVVKEYTNGDLYYDNDVTSLEKLKLDNSSNTTPAPKAGRIDKLSNFAHSLTYWWQSINNLIKNNFDKTATDRSI